MKPRIIWIILGVLAIVAILFGGLLPLPGQKDNTTPLVQPSRPGKSLTPTQPTGPPESGLPIEPAPGTK
jgi:hypothetical protein